ncbi:MAG: hypothetical protein M3436_12120 [Pseudomonadota bacterium]|nr:hypothetical protein [Pseudomonadota bacterium]
MTTATDFIGTVYDTLAKLMNMDNASPSLFMQMAWPGYSLSPADFKAPDAPNGPYDAEIAKETVSQVANIVPTLNKGQFENSGFEVDDLYAILISSAIPVGATPDTLATNPLNRLFSDAQYELLQARRGSKSDPNVFYYPCTATPSNWYDEAASQHWSAIQIKSADIKPANTPISLFTKSGGLTLANKGILKLRPDVVNESALKKDIQQTIGTKDLLVKQRMGPAAAIGINPRPMDAHIALASGTTIGATPKLAGTSSARAATFSNDLSAARNAAVFTKKSSPVNIFGDTTFKANLQNIQLNQQNLDASTSKNLSLTQRILVKDLINQTLPTKPVSPATEGFNISFKFCRVNIDRDWFNLALLVNRNWYMFNTAAHEYSTGTADNNPGMFPLLPLSFIAIRDLRITANWSQEDRSNLEKAVSFGFFDIRNGTLNQNTLEVQGLQIIFWISKLTPPLPPVKA